MSALEEYFAAHATGMMAFNNYEQAKAIWLQLDREAHEARLVAVLSVPCPAAQCGAEFEEPCNFSPKPPMVSKTWNTHPARQNLSGVNGPDAQGKVIEDMAAGTTGYRQVAT